MWISLLSTKQNILYLNEDILKRLQKKIKINNEKLLRNKKLIIKNKLKNINFNKTIY